MASMIRKSLSEQWPDKTWQVLVGRNFGSFVTYEDKHYVYFYIGQMGFVIFA